MTKRGFTLAEVLITLVIIGFVSTLTIPTLQANIWKYRRNAMTKAMITKLENTFRVAAADMDYSPKCGYWSVRPESFNIYTIKQKEILDDQKDSEGNDQYKYTWEWTTKDEEGNDVPTEQPKDWNGMYDDCRAYGNAIVNKLQVAKICDGNGVADGCIPPYDGSEKVAQARGASEAAANLSTSGAPSFRTSFMQNNAYVVVLKDGTILISYSKEYFNPSIFTIDVNGMKGPNKWGYDLYPIRGTIYPPDYRNTILKQWGGASYTHPGGVELDQILSNKV